jgi:hypothetical protein
MERIARVHDELLVIVYVFLVDEFLKLMLHIDLHAPYGVFVFAVSGVVMYDITHLYELKRREEGRIVARNQHELAVSWQ